MPWYNSWYKTAQRQADCGIGSVREVRNYQECSAARPGDPALQRLGQWRKDTALDRTHSYPCHRLEAAVPQGRRLLPHRQAKRETKATTHEATVRSGAHCTEDEDAQRPRLWARSLDVQHPRRLDREAFQGEVQIKDIAVSHIQESL